MREAPRHIFGRIPDDRHSRAESHRFGPEYESDTTVRRYKEKHSARRPTASIRKYMPEQCSARDQIRVLHVLDKFSIDGRSLHGVARLMSWWVSAIDRQHFELNILGLRAPNEASRHVEEKGGRVFYSDRAKLSPGSILDILRVARVTETDLLHLHGYKSCTLGRIAGAILDVPVILHEHGAFPSVPFHQRLADWVLSPLGDKMIVVSEAVKEFCVEHRSMRSEEVEVVFNGIPVDEFQNVSGRAVQKVADELSLDSSTPIIGTVARLDEEKGVSYLLEAIPAIQEKVPELKVLIVGDGSLRGDLEEKAEQLGIAQDLVFTGERRDVPRLYKLMDVKVISSIYEGIPLTLFEAMAAGTPIVSTAVGGIDELVENGENGVLVQSQRPTEIADAVVDLLQNRERRQKISKRAQEKVQEFSVQISMSRIEEIYRKVLR